MTAPADEWADPDVASSVAAMTVGVGVAALAVHTADETSSASRGYHRATTAVRPRYDPGATALRRRCEHRRSTGGLLWSDRSMWDGAGRCLNREERRSVLTAKDQQGPSRPALL